jgi:uncharacterized membrane protein (UPF0136 family)
MRIAGWTTIIYAIIVFVGGIVGHSLAGSRASLISGIVFSILLVISGLGLLFHRKFSAIFALALTLILDGFFTYRFMLSFSFMPAGMMALLTLIVLIIQVYSLRRSPH